MYKIKICGVTQEETADVLNDTMPDFTGFILSPGFGRSIPKERAAAIRRRLNPAIRTVGVFVNEPIGNITVFVREGIVQVVQLHGDEDDGYILRLKERCPDVRIIKAVGVENGKLPAYPEHADCLLLDAHDRAARGGTGRKIEWRRYEADKPIILAGGLTPENVREALRAVRPYGVDVSGGVETDGRKDERKIREYIKNIRQEKL